MANTNLRIKQICQEKGIQVKDLASRLNMRPASLSQALCRNVFSIPKLAEIADALEVTIPELFEDYSLLKANEEDKNEGRTDTLICPHCNKQIKLQVYGE